MYIYIYIYIYICKDRAPSSMHSGRSVGSAGGWSWSVGGFSAGLSSWALGSVALSEDYLV